MFKNNNVVEEILVTRILDTEIVIFGSKILVARILVIRFWSQDSGHNHRGSSHRDSGYRNRDSGHRDGHRLQQHRSRSTVGVCHTVTRWEDRTEFFPQGLYNLLSRGHRQAKLSMSFREGTKIIEFWPQLLETAFESLWGSFAVL